MQNTLKLNTLHEDAIDPNLLQTRANNAKSGFDKDATCPNLLYVSIMGFSSNTVNFVKRVATSL